MSVQNLEVTAGTAKDVDFTKNDATVNDKLTAAIYVNGALRLTKKSAANGGSSDEIGIVAATKYTVKLSAKDTLQLPTSGVTYKLFKFTGNAREELFNGTITVSAAVESDTVVSEPVAFYKHTQVFTEDGAFDAQLPAGAMLDAIVVVNPNGYTLNIDIGSVPTGDDICQAHNTATAELTVPALLKKIVSKDNATSIWVTCADWHGGELELTMVWKKVLG